MQRMLACWLCFWQLGFETVECQRRSRVEWNLTRKEHKSWEQRRIWEPIPKARLCIHYVISKGLVLRLVTSKQQFKKSHSHSNTWRTGHSPAPRKGQNLFLFQPFLAYDRFAWMLCCVNKVLGTLSSNRRKKKAVSHQNVLGHAWIKWFSIKSWQDKNNPPHEFHVWLSLIQSYVSCLVAFA